MELSPALKHVLAWCTTLGTIGVATHNFPSWMKITYSAVVGIGGVLYAANEWHTFYKNYRTVWIIVKIEHIIKFIKDRRKPRKRGLLIRRRMRDSKYP